jgi:hypothetical protein
MNNVHFKAMAVLGCDLADVRRRGACKHNCCDGENCLIWLDKQFGRLMKYDESGLSPEEVQELAKAKAEGRLLVLPCKVGTRVWVIGQDCDLCHDMYTEEPCLFGDCEYRKVIESVFLPGMTDEFGKTVFLTREEAEKAIGGKEDE